MPTVVCPGCGLGLPATGAVPDPTYNASPECRSVYDEVIAYGLAHPARLARWHQTCTDAYRLQHLTPSTKPISTAFALNSLYLVLERGFTGIQAREAHGATSPPPSAPGRGSSPPRPPAA